MPTNYKVLGQVTGTAPTTSTATVNLVTDPSFEGITITERTALSSTNSNRPLTGFGTTPWVGFLENSNTRITTNIIESYPALTNGGTTALGFFVPSGVGAGNTACRLTLGINSDTSSFILNPNTSIPVVGGTTIYPAFSFYRNDGTVQTFNFTIWQYNTSDPNNHITNTIYSQSNGSWSSSNGVNGWFRFVATNGITLQSNTNRVVVQIVYSTGSNVTTGIVFDGIVVGTSLSYATNFVTPNDATTVAPFTARLNPGYSGTPLASSSVQSFAGTQNTLYTVPAGTQTVASTISIANLGTTAATYRIAVRPSGQTLATRHWLAFDTPIGANSTDTFTLGITMSAGDVIIVQTDSSLVSFSAFGSEIS